MSFLLDTNVVSESTKPRPNPGMVAWLAGVEEESAFLSVITLTELRYGVERLAPGRRRRRLDRWLQQELPLRFEGRILPSMRLWPILAGSSWPAPSRWDVRLKPGTRSSPPRRRSIG